LPVPFGLVRFGVSPLHPDVKKVINKFTCIATNPNFQFIGNTNVGKNGDVSLECLRKNYNAVVLSYGSSEDKLLNIPGEYQSNIFSSKGYIF
jgi:adrenodoxin-NADP+ reductase